MESNRKILLIEGDDFYVEVIETFVKLFLQLQLVSVKTIAEARDCILDEKPDLILLDLEVSKTEPLEFAEKLRDDAQTKTIPILAISADGSRHDSALGRGCDAFLTKPFKVRELEQLVTKLVERD